MSSRRKLVQTVVGRDGKARIPKQECAVVTVRGAGKAIAMNMAFMRTYIEPGKAEFIVYGYDSKKHEFTLEFLKRAPEDVKSYRLWRGLHCSNCTAPSGTFFLDNGIVTSSQVKRFRVGHIDSDGLVLVHITRDLISVNERVVELEKKTVEKNK